MNVPSATTRKEQVRPLASLEKNGGAPGLGDASTGAVLRVVLAKDGRSNLLCTIWS